MYSSTLLLLLAAFSSVNALATPHLRSPHHHRAIAARVAAPTPQVDLPVLTPKKRSSRRRSLSRRCKTRAAPSSSLVSSSSAAVSSSAAAVPVNVASAPPSFSSSSSSSTQEETQQATTAAPTTASPTPTPTPTPTSTQAPATTSQSSSSGDQPSYLVGTQSGQGTFYGTGLGSCGITNTDSDYIAAVSHLLYDSFPGYNGANPNNNPVCGKKVTAHYQGKSVTVTITDRCTGCAVDDLDFSPSAFLQLADEALGRIDITWDWD